MRFGESKTQYVPRAVRKESVQEVGLSEEQVKAIILAQLEAQEPQLQEMTPKVVEAVEKVIEKTEVVKEVSVITKDNRARQYCKAIRSKLEASSHKLAIVSDVQDIQNKQIEDLQELTFKLQTKLAELEKREAAIEAVIPEEIQEVKEVKVPVLLYVGVGVSLVLSVLSLLLK